MTYGASVILRPEGPKNLNERSFAALRMTA